MSTFAVFGMTRAHALQMAQKRTPSWRSNTDAPGGREQISMDDWKAAVERGADRVMEQKRSCSFPRYSTRHNLLSSLSSFARSLARAAG